MNALAWWGTLDSVGYHTMRVLVSVLWQSSVLLAAAALLAFLLRRRRASARHAVWTVALLLVPLLPLLAWGASGIGTPQAEIPVMPTYSAAQVEFVTVSPAVGAPLALDVGPAEVVPQPPQVVDEFSLTDYPWALALLAYAAGTTVLLSLVIVGRGRIRAWVRGGRAVADDRVLARFEEARERLGLDGRLRIVESESVPTPMTVCMFRPVVLLPAGLTERLSDAELRSVAVHELAHVKRRDPLVLALVSLTRAFLFFHPLVWLAARQVSNLAEAACDDAVLDAGGEPVSYAKMLARLAEELPRRSVTTELAAGIVLSKGAFLRRVQAILSDRRDRIRKLTRWALAATVLAAILSLGVALALPLGEKSTASEPGDTSLELVGEADDAEEGKAEQSRDNMHQIQIGCLMYAEDHDGEWPDELQPLVDRGYIPSADVFRNPSRVDADFGYVYTKPPRHAAAGTIVLYEAHDTWPENGILVGRKDTAVLLIKDEAEFKKLLGAPAPAAAEEPAWLEPARVVLSFIEAALAEDDVGAMRSFPRPPSDRIETQTEPMREIAKLNPGWHFEPATVLTGQDEALVAGAAELQADHDRRGVFCFSLKRAEGTWQITDIDFESAVRIQDEITRFIERHPGCNVWHRTDVEVVVQAEADPATEQLRALVEDFFRHNYRDITARETLEWGEPQMHTDGNRSIRYKYRATIWGRDQVIRHKVFTFGPEGEFVSVDDVKTPLEGTKEEMQTLVVDFFAHNWRDITSRKTIQWGEVERDPVGNFSIRYKFEATIHGKDTVVLDKVFSFRPEGEFVKVEDAEAGAEEEAVGSPQGPVQEAVPAPGALSFGPVIERVVNDDNVDEDMFIDLDTGRLFSPPRDLERPDEKAFLAWLEGNGIDGMCETNVSVRGLPCFDMVVQPVASEQWERFTPEALRRRMAWATPGRPVFMTAKGELPATYLFRTREGGMGILQIVGFTDDPPGVKIRYKMVQGARESAAQEDLQRLINAATPGSVVTIPPGIYRAPIVIERPLTLKGEDPETCVLELTADEPCVVVSSKEPVTIDSVTIKWQLARSEKSEGPVCALAVKDGNANIRNCRFIALGNIKRCPSAVQCLGFSNVKLDNCRFEGFEFTIGYSGGAEGSVTDCLVLNPGHCGITVYSGSKLDVARNIVTGSGYHGMRCTGGTLLAHDNLIIKNKNRGIYLGNKSASGRVSNNAIMGNGTGIGAFAQTDVTIENNLILDSDYAGLGTRDSCPITVRNNVFQANTRGIIIFEEAGRNLVSLGQNSFWKNGTDTENIERPRNSILVDPRFKAVEQGDFFSQADELKRNEQGLSDPGVFRDLWQKWRRISPERHLLPEERAQAPQPAAPGVEKEEAAEVAPDELSFGPVIERVVNDDNAGQNMFIDVDTGRLWSAPEDLRGKGAEAQLAWCRKNGVDAVGDCAASVRGLAGFDVLMLPIPNASWLASADEVPGLRELWELRQTEGSATRPARRRPVLMSAKGELPATFVFKTREGGMGILQIVGFTDDPPGVKIRYKMVQAGPAFRSFPPKTAFVPYADRPTIVDGNLAEWGGLPPVPPSYTRQAELLKVDHAFWLAWHEDGLYGAVMVGDTDIHVDPMKIWDTDGFRLFLELDHARSPVPTENSISIAFGPRPEGNAGPAFIKVHWPGLPATVERTFRAVGKEEKTGTVAAWARTEDGYNLEFHIPAEVLEPAKMQPGTKIGMSLNVVVNGRVPYQFHGLSYEAATEPDTWGTGLFGQR